ncbi:MAG: hypothetical protein J4452_03735 [Candidatus Aenigmarchaeota archaeon]|nr:hypothetical protein [Candidatus Aenigmarchaeota archaeon]
MKISILDLKDSSTALFLSKGQKKELQNLLSNEKIKLPISRLSIQTKRLNQAYTVMSDDSKLVLEQILKKIKLRAGCSKCIESTFNIQLTPELCWLYGFLVGDGNTINVCRFYNINEKLVEQVNSTVKNHFNVEIKKEPNRSIDYIIPKPVLIVLESFFGRKGKSVNARVPTLLFSLPNDFVACFVRGLFDTDGTLVCNPEITTPNLNLLKDVQLLLKSKFDIYSRIRKAPRKYESHKHIQHTLTLGMFDRVKTFANVLKFYEIIGFTHPDKKLKLIMKMKSRTLYAVLQLVKGGFQYSDGIKEVLHKDWSTVIDHLNKLEKLGLIKKEPEKAYNLIKYKWDTINQDQKRSI